MPGAVRGGRTLPPVLLAGCLSLLTPGAGAVAQDAGGPRGGPPGGPPGAAGPEVAQAVSRQAIAATHAGFADDHAGAVGAGLLLRRLDGAGRVLMIGAHPDDEDTALLAALARGHGMRAGYLSLTRGGGGQNLIGPELGEGLGMVRTGELLAARELDGAEQFFTRAFDFGFSKTADEALALWPREELLRDVVRVVRSFRPQVVVSVFTGTPADGHGQHQAAGVMAREAFHAAADRARFPEQLEAGLEPWQPAKLYLLTRRNPGDATVRVPTGVFDPLFGRSWFQIAMESRSQHRSQDMGQGEPLGPRASSLALLETAPGVEAGEGGLFAGVDTTLIAMAAAGPTAPGSAVRSALEAYGRAIAAAEERLSALAPWDAAPPLAEALEGLRTVESTLAARAAGPSFLLEAVQERIGDASEALLDAAGVVMDLRVDDDFVVAGQAVGLEVELWNGGPLPVRDARARPEAPAGWTIEPAFEGAGRRDVAAGSSEVWRYEVRLPADAGLSRPYHLEREPDGAMYRWPAGRPDVWGLPRTPPPVRAAVDLTLEPGPGAGPVRAGIRRSARFVGVDKASGEYTAPLLVVPALSVAAEPAVMISPMGSTEARTVSVALRAFAPDGASGVLRLDAPAGWTVAPGSIPFSLGSEDSQAAFTFRVTPPSDAAPGRYAVRPVARAADGHEFDESVRILDYPHIDRSALFEPAASRVTVVPVRVADVRVGYVMGSGDEGFGAVRELGLDAELLGPADLEEGDLSRFDVIVLGVRAYETRPDLVAANERVLGFARAGGTLVVQYNKYEFDQGGFAPFPVGMSRPHDRTTDETAPVRLLEPGAPVFTTPNRITGGDFEGWVTERGLYYLGDWDERYTPLLEMSDPGEGPERGALVVAPLGEGLYVYTGLSFFRQLPAGVPGAWRLFANLVSLRPEAWREWSGGRP